MTHPFEAAREAALGALIALAEGDPRIEALWLQGSLAAGGADAFSDIDAYLAAADDGFESLWAEREVLLQRLGGALAWSDVTTPGLHAVHALMRSGTRLDLFFEKSSAAGVVERPAAKVLMDKTGVTAALRLGWSPPQALVARVIHTIIRMTRQGATWPLRVLGRGEWPTLAMMELDLVNAQLAQLMAVKRDPANFYRNPFAMQLVLSSQERAELEALTDDALAALAARDTSALKGVHLRLLDALVREGRACCAALEVDYPIGAAEELAVRQLIDRNWPA